MSKELSEAWVTIYHYNDEIIHDIGSEYVENPLKEELDIVSDALLKAQKQEKENTKYKNVFKIIKEKCLYNSNLNFVAICDSYNVYKRRMTEKWDTEINWDNKEVLDFLKLLTREEFDSIKEMLNCS